MYVNLSRTKSGDLWATHIENKNLQKPNGKPIFQDFEIKVAISIKDRNNNNRNFNILSYEISIL